MGENQNKQKKSKRGGPRPGSGRKRTEVRVLRELEISKAHAVACRALALCEAYVDNCLVPPSIRLAAASEIMDRVWGKPKQAIDHTTDGKALNLTVMTPAPVVEKKKAVKEEDD